MTDLSEWDTKLPYRPPHDIKAPKPNRPVACPRSCGSTKEEHVQLYTRPGAKDFYWRYYKCDRCKGNFWIGVQYTTHETVVTISTPKIEKTTLLTGNLKFILPAGHPLVTADYKPFLRTGELPKDVRYAIEEEREAAGRAADAAMQVSEEPKTLNPEVTSISNPEEDDMAIKEYPLPDTLICRQCGMTDTKEWFSEGKSVFTDPDRYWRWIPVKHMRPDCQKNSWFGTDRAYKITKTYRDKPPSSGAARYDEPAEQELRAQEQAEKELQQKVNEEEDDGADADAYADYTHRQEFDALLIQQNIVELAPEQYEALFLRWRAVVHPPITKENTNG